MRLTARTSAFAGVVLTLAFCGCGPGDGPLPTAAMQGRKAPASRKRPQASRPEPPATEWLTQNAEGVMVARLSNGLTVIVKPTRSAPVVCVRAYVGAGSLYEREWLGSGISHLAEHLLAVEDEQAQSAAKQANPRLRRIREIGGQSNAFTSQAHTCYHISAAAGKTLECIDLIADWLARPDIRQEDFDREHGVVQRELEMGKDDPEREMWRLHAGAVYGAHPAGVSIIGMEAPLRGLTREDVLAYQRRMYVPQNMVFCVVGDVDAQAVLERTRQAFAGFEPAAQPDLSLPEISPVAGVRRMVGSHQALKETLENISFLTIALLHEDLYPLDVLSDVLTEGGASRLVEQIQRRRRLVTGVSSASWTPSWGRGTFSISFRSSDDNADAAEKAILAELKAIADTGVKSDELARAKRQKVASYVYSQETAESIAATLAGDYTSTGDVEFSRNYTSRIQAVTAEQVQQAAKKYFTFDKMVITRMVPRSKFSVAAVGAAAKKASAAGVFALPNGLRVVLSPDETSGLVSMAFVTRGGLLAETKATNGLGTLMTALSTKGAGAYSAEDIAAFFDQAGGGIAGSCGNNSFHWQATVLADSFDKALDVFADVIEKPAFTQKELDILRPLLLTAIKQVDEDWSSQLRKFFQAKFFTNSPYRMLSAGSESVIQKATPEQVAEYYRAWIKAGGSCLAIYGKFDAAAARNKIERIFTRLPPGKVEMKLPSAREVKSEGERFVLRTQNKVAGVIVAAPGMTIDNLQDRFAIDVLDTIISGYELPSGWLHEELRGKQLVYVVHAYNWPGLAPGAFVTYAACQPDKAATVVNIIERNLRRAAAYTPTQQEVDQAVNVILTAQLLDNQSTAKLAMSAALDEAYGLGYDFHVKLERYYRKVAPADVLRVGARYLGGAYVVAVTTPQPEGPPATQEPGGK